MPAKKSVKKNTIKKRAKKIIKKNIKTKTLTLTSLKKVEEEEKTCWDYSPEKWMEKEAKRVGLEFKKYAPDLEPDSDKSAKECACAAMTLAHHGTKEAIETLKKFKKDPRAPMWIDCGIEECVRCTPCQDSNICFFVWILKVDKLIILSKNKLLEMLKLKGIIIRRNILTALRRFCGFVSSIIF